MFRPSPRQKGFMAQVSAAREANESRLDGKPAIFISDFVSTVGMLFDPPIMMSEWRRWEGMDGFVDWWADRLPQYSETTILDLRMQGQAFFQGITRGMVNGEGWAFNAHVKTLALEKYAQGRNNPVATDVSDWLADSQKETNWTRNVAEAK